MIKKGDLCEVIGGVMGEKSPNLGLIVQVLAYVGDDPTFGRIWRCEAQYAELWRNQEGATPNHPNTTPPGQADFAQDWLKKIDPPAKTDSKSTNKDLETTS